AQGGGRPGGCGPEPPPRWSPAVPPASPPPAAPPPAPPGNSRLTVPVRAVDGSVCVFVRVQPDVSSYGSKPRYAAAPGPAFDTWATAKVRSVLKMTDVAVPHPSSLAWIWPRIVRAITRPDRSQPAGGDPGV